MIHYNSFLKSKGIGGILKNLALPEMYIATSIKDFVEERGDIQPTKNSQHYIWDLFQCTTQFDLRERALVVIPSVRYHECFFNIGGLEDFTQKMVTAPIYPDDFQRDIDQQEIKPGETVRALIMYDTKIDFPYLLALFKNISSAPRKISAEGRFSAFDLVLVPA